MSLKNEHKVIRKLQRKWKVKYHGVKFAKKGTLVNTCLGVFFTTCLQSLQKKYNVILRSQNIQRVFNQSL